MNPTLTPISPLPEALRQPRQWNGAGRRNRIGDHRIDPDALQHFNVLLEQLDLSHPPLDPDQVASAARELVDRLPHAGRAPPCIQQRMRRAAAIDRMLGDRDWHVAGTSAAIASKVVDYLRGNGKLIPNAVPMVGRLDDVILVEASWPAIAQEVHDYLAFCRVRHVEAELRGESRRHFGFTRDQWQDAFRAEVAWIAHCHRVSGSSYVAADAESRFRIN